MNAVSDDEKRGSAQDNKDFVRYINPRLREFRRSADAWMIPMTMRTDVGRRMFREFMSHVDDAHRRAVSPEMIEALKDMYYDLQDSRWNNSAWNGVEVHSSIRDGQGARAIFAFSNGRRSQPFYFEVPFFVTKEQIREDLEMSRRGAQYLLSDIAEGRFVHPPETRAGEGKAHTECLLRAYNPRLCRCQGFHRESQMAVLRRRASFGKGFDSFYFGPVCLEGVDVEAFARTLVRGDRTDTPLEIFAQVVRTGGDLPSAKTFAHRQTCAVHELCGSCRCKGAHTTLAANFEAFVLPDRPAVALGQPCATELRTLLGDDWKKSFRGLGFFENPDHKKKVDEETEFDGGSLDLIAPDVNHPVLEFLGLMRDRAWLRWAEPTDDTKQHYRCAVRMNGGICGPTDMVVPAEDMYAVGNTRFFHGICSYCVDVIGEYGSPEDQDMMVCDEDGYIRRFLDVLRDMPPKYRDMRHQMEFGAPVRRTSKPRDAERRARQLETSQAGPAKGKSDGGQKHGGGGKGKKGKK